MKLIYELDSANRTAFEAAGGGGEKILYCIPFEYEDTGTVDGYMVLTPTHLYKLCDGNLAAKWEMCRMSDFSVEMMYGCAGFYAFYDGNAVLLCRFATGKSLVRYTVLAHGCDMVASGRTENLPTSDEPVRYCPKCGRPFIRNTHICPYCRDKGKIYKTLWQMTKGMRIWIMAPLMS